jgi:hypothetical protein
VLLREDVDADGSLTYSAFLNLILTQEHGGQFRPFQRLDLADSYERRLSTIPYGTNSLPDPESILRR